MNNTIFSERDAYRFIKVEKYFQRYREWDAIGDLLGYEFNQKEFFLRLKFSINGKEDYYGRIEFLDDDIFRFRFNPNLKDFKYNSASVLQDSHSELRKALYNHERNVKEIQAQRSITCQEILKEKKFLSFKCSKYGFTTMVVIVYFSPFQIEVRYTGLTHQEDYLSAPVTWRTAIPAVYYTPNGREDYAIIQNIQKPANSKYVGFGEQGGVSLTKNTDQLNYFNYDNMRYMQIYNKGPLDSRQPLYHSQPIFFEYNIIPGEKVANALFVANGGQVLIDLGYSNSSRYMLGTRMGDMDFFYFIGCNTSSLVSNYTSVVGRSNLKPRYILGYHQGCYGYDRREIVEWAVDKHREYKIPLDGMHIDVDIQHRYQTFTIDTEKFPNPKEMFANLRKKGIKCSTNITPVISREDENYQSYRQARDNGYFVLDRRYGHEDPQSRKYHNYEGGNQRIPNNPERIQGFNSGRPFVGGVYYGSQNGVDLGTTGHYPDFGRRQVREWWGTQYKYLMETGLEFVWQDMTTPAIRDIYGDMKSFPSRLLVSSSYYKKKDSYENSLTPFIKQWNLYAYNLHKATFNGLNALQCRNNKRNFIIGRGSFTGSHRFAGLWTGDNSSDWNFLKMNVSQALSLGMCGVIINGQDIGGFEQDRPTDKWVDPELLIRWTCAGAFLPWFRNHYVRKGRKDFQEIFMFEQYFRERNLPLPQPQDLYQMVLPICKHYIEVRYRHLQLFYDLMFENTLTGLPICRPLFFEAPEDLTLFNDKTRFLNNQFFVGRDMLIAPILWPRFDKGYDTKGERNIYLPIGNDWYQFKNNSQPLGDLVEGGTTIRDFDASLNLDPGHINFIVPIYIKEGGIIPTIQLEQYVGELHDKGQPNPITFNIYPGKPINKRELQSGVVQFLTNKTPYKYKCYIDDGVSRSSAWKKAHPVQEGGDAFANDEYQEVHVSHITVYENQTKKITQRNVFIRKKHDSFTPHEKSYFVALLHGPKEHVPVKQVRIDNQRIPQHNRGGNNQNSQDLWASQSNSWYYNDYLRTTFVKVQNHPSQILITAEYY